METRAIVILYQGKEPGAAQCALITAQIANILSIEDNVSITTMNQEDISKLLVGKILLKPEPADKDEEAVEQALIYLTSTYSKGITSEQAVIETFAREGNNRTEWLNMLKILCSNTISKKLMSKHCVSSTTLSNLKKAYFACVQAGRI